MQDILTVKNLKTEAILGIHTWERRVKQPIILTVELQFDANASAKSGNLADSIDYVEVANLLRERCQAGQFELVEALANHLCESLFTSTDTGFIRLTIEKPAAIKGADHAAITVERARS